MASRVDYAPPLRALGQAIELLHFQKFELEPIGKDFLVRAWLRPFRDAMAEKAGQKIPVEQVWGMIPDCSKRERVPPASGWGSSAALELRYTPKDIDRFEQAGRAKRGDPKGMADATRLSQQLRAVGEYVTQKRARLSKVSINGQSLTVRFERVDGRDVEELLSGSDLSDFSIRMGKKRTGLHASSL